MLDRTDGFKKSELDLEIEARIAGHCAKFSIDRLTAVKLFPVLARRQWLKRFLSHVELFKMALDVPGDIAELGVYRGLGLFTWANLLETWCIGDRTKRVWGFDNWRGFSRLSDQDGSADVSIGKAAGGFDSERWFDEIESAVAIYDADRFIPQKQRIVLVNGDIEAIELPTGAMFSLVHFDCDLYAPTRAALAAFWDHVPPGGLMVFDEYGIPDWPGETTAVNEFIADKQVRLRTFAWTNTPGAFLVKP
jgi:hypothetical protein